MSGARNGRMRCLVLSEVEGTADFTNDRSCFNQPRALYTTTTSGVKGLLWEMVAVSPCVFLTLLRGLVLTQ